MAKTDRSEASSDASVAPEARRTKNIHLDVDPELHHELQVMVALKRTKIKHYGIEALREKLAADRAAMEAGRAK